MTDSTMMMTDSSKDLRLHFQAFNLIVLPLAVTLLFVSFTTLRVIFNHTEQLFSEKKLWKKHTELHLFSSKQQTDTVERLAGEHIGAYGCQRARYFPQEPVKTKTSVNIGLKRLGTWV